MKTSLLALLFLTPTWAFAQQAQDLYNTRSYEIEPYPQVHSSAIERPLYNLKGHRINPSVPYGQASSVSSAVTTQSVSTTTVAPSIAERPLPRYNDNDVIVTRVTHLRESYLAPQSSTITTTTTSSEAINPVNIPVGIIEEKTYEVPFVHPARPGFGKTLHVPTVDLGATGPGKAVPVEWSLDIAHD